MSHFSQMAARFSNLQQVVDTLRFMGVPASEILVHPSLGLRIEGLGALESLRRSVSSRWPSGSEQRCPVIVTEKGMKALAAAGGATANLFDVNGLRTSVSGQRAEIGFYDCGCDPDQPQYVMSADGYEAGNKFPGYFTACYQVVGLQAPGSKLEASQVTYDEESSSFKILVRPRAATGRNAGRTGSSKARNILGRA